MAVSEALSHHAHQWLSVCADNLNLPRADDLLDALGYKQQLQKHALERVHELKWAEVYAAVTPEQKVRLVEGAEPFANSWLRAIPAHPGLTLTDQQVKYGTQRILLQNLC